MVCTPQTFGELLYNIGGLVIYTSGNGTSILWAGATPSLYLNEDLVEIGQLNSLPVADIAYVKAFRPPSILGGYNASQGAIAIYTRKGRDQPAEPGKGMLSKMVMGYTPVKEFYSPNYNMDQVNDVYDVRSTLYWNPMIITTPENNKISLTFYNNDITNAFRIILEGVTAEGKLIHLEKVIE